MAHSSTTGDEVHDDDEVKNTVRGPKSTRKLLFDTRSTSHVHSKKISSVSDCWRYMVRGSSLIKVRPNGRTYNRYFSLDEDLSSLRWIPTSKKASKAAVAIASIREVRCVHTSEVQGVSPAGLSSTSAVSTSPDWTFSIIHGEDFSSLDLIAASAEEATIWVTGLNALLGTNQLSPNALGDTSALRERWLRKVFERAASESSATSTTLRRESHTDDDANDADNSNLDQNAAIALLKEINAELTTGRIRQKMAEFDSMKCARERGRINSNEFVTMFQEMATRPEIYFLLIRFANRDYFTAEDFQNFLECEQSMVAATQEKCNQMVQLYEPSSEAKSNNQLLLDGMTRYLLSEEGDIFHPMQLNVHQNMSAPLVHYFISSSHNTYLLEDQLRGPSSVEGYARALQSGCRCVKVDVWDGTDMPVVCHGNTLTTKIAFCDVIAVIAEYAFDASKYPLIIHLENHCSVPQQRLVARIMRDVFAASLYIPAEHPNKLVSQCSPEELVGQIIIAGKQLDCDQQADDGEVTDEDEGGETNRKSRANPRTKLKLCRELSNLVALNRSSSSKLIASRDKRSLQGNGFSISESAALRILSGSPSVWSEVTQRSMLRVFPNGSRIDSSNFSPQEFWNAGVPLVALNFQTPGLMMDLYDGKFRQNGGCGYVLKPAMMRQPAFNIPMHLKDAAPASPPQLLRIRVISGQQLPRPRGSAAKSVMVDPYVLIQIYGIPIDCAEKKTRTIPDEGDCPIFEESLEFYIHHPDMALIRFIVLDDEFIGDDFIGQYTIPFPCIRTGYRHVRLLSNLGESLENATLFVHIAISEKWAGEQLWNKNSRTKSSKKQSVIRMTGIKSPDDHFKGLIESLVEANRARSNVAQALFELRSECGLPFTANIKQCLRVLLQRLANCPDVRSCQLSSANVFPVMKIDGSNNGSNLPAPLHRTVVSFEKSILECHFLCEKSGPILRDLEEKVSPLVAFHDQLDQLVDSQGLKGKQRVRAYDVYGWNMNLITNETELLRQCHADCAAILEQIRGTSVNLLGFNRHCSGRGERVSLQLTLQPLGAEDMELPLPTGTCSPPIATPNGSLSQYQQPTNAQLSRSASNSQPLQKDVETRLKSILKKCGSSVDVTIESGGYAHDVHDADSPPVATNVVALISTSSSPPSASTPSPLH